MKYRKFGHLDWEVSALGFGAMRLPLAGEQPADIDEPEVVRMIRYAIDHGVNYVDSAYGYHGGRSEVVVGKALQDGYREKVRLATKLPPWLVNVVGDCDRFLNEQMERLQVSRVDYYLFHGLNKDRWDKLNSLGMLRWAEGAMADGRIGYLGFSFHGDFSAFKEIIDGYDNWTLCQIQYNYMDIDNQAGTRGLKYAAGEGLAVVIMEPIRGGRLSKVTPEPISKLWAAAPRQRTPAEWALQWVWNQPEVSLALSGMSTMEQVVENVASAGRSRPGTLTADELAVIAWVREAYIGLIPVPCTHCGYCLPCPQGVEIPRIFELYNDACIYNDPKGGRFRYRAGPQSLREEQRADRCTKCGECVEVCPQGIPVPDWLEKVHEMFG